MKLDMGAFSSTGEITSKLLEVNVDRVVIETATVMNLSTGAPAKPAKSKLTLKAKVPQNEAEKEGLPEAMTGTATPLPDEKQTVGGKEYDCKVVEFTGTKDGAQATGKSWRNEEVPGSMVKIEMKATVAGNAMTMTMTLKKMELQ